MAERDLVFMRRALSLAKAQKGRTGNNPSVGCVLVSPAGTVLSEAATATGGTPHAEQLALSKLDGQNLVGATAYVTLEPCYRRSSGGPSCSELLQSAGIARLVCAVSDPHPNGAGGLNRLERADIRVELGLLGEEARALYADFFARIA